MRRPRVDPDEVDVNPDGTADTTSPVTIEDLREQRRRLRRANDRIDKRIDELRDRKVANRTEIDKLDVLIAQMQAGQP